MPMRFLYLLGFVVVVSLLMSWRERKQRQSAWTGVVTDIKHQRRSIARDEDRRDEDRVTVYYRTDEGKSGKFKLRMAGFRQCFESLRVGDRLNKQEGQYLPGRPQSELAEAPAAEQI